MNGGILDGCLFDAAEVKVYVCGGLVAADDDACSYSCGKPGDKLLLLGSDGFGKLAAELP